MALSSAAVEGEHARAGRRTRSARDFPAACLWPPRSYRGRQVGPRCSARRARSVHQRLRALEVRESCGPEDIGAAAASAVISRGRFPATTKLGKRRYLVPPSCGAWERTCRDTLRKGGECASARRAVAGTPLRRAARARAERTRGKLCRGNDERPRARRRMRDPAVRGAPLDQLRARRAGFRARPERRNQTNVIRRARTERARDLDPTAVWRQTSAASRRKPPPRAAT